MVDIHQEVDWTILIYANGNNDLEPEMRQAMLDVEKVGSNAHVHVVMQIGRAEYELVKLFRPDIDLKDQDCWSGVRRYYVHRGKSELVEDLKYVNMADPKQFYHFIQWGMLSYPAKKYMLILGGHSYHCIGMLTDYSGETPYIMGIPEMVKATNMASSKMGKKIDILLLDTCCSNSLELIYEFGKDENYAVQNVITYIANGPIEGLPYHSIIKIVQANSNINDNTLLTKEIIENLSYHLISFEIDHKKLREIKQMFHEKTLEYLSKSAEDDQDYKQNSFIQKNILQYISDNSPPLSIYYKRGRKDTCSLITVTTSVAYHLKLMTHYYNLGFIQDNCWASLLNDQPADINRIFAMQKEERLIPLEMSPQEVYESISIMNPDLDDAHIRNILEKLYCYKKWTL
ncbi:MAG: clostripain-related cysteine peptidase [Anaerotignum sp.]|nr:clostripain-related cysteine peptidase [Anaerotignum sp.]